jgi:hypothetical protein
VGEEEWAKRGRQGQFGTNSRTEESSISANSGDKHQRPTTYGEYADSVGKNEEAKSREREREIHSVLIYKETSRNCRKRVPIIIDEIFEVRKLRRHPIRFKV